MILRAKLVSGDDSLWLTDEANGIYLRGGQPIRDEGQRVTVGLYARQESQGALLRKLHEIEVFLRRAEAYEAHRAGSKVELWLKVNDGVDAEPIFGRGWLRRRVTGGRTHLPASYGPLLTDDTIDQLEVVCDVMHPWWYGREQWVAFTTKQGSVTPGDDGSVDFDGLGNARHFVSKVIGLADAFEVIPYAEGTLHLLWRPGQASTHDTDQQILYHTTTLGLYFRAADDKFVFTDGTNTIASVSAHSFAAGEDIYLTAVWGTDTMKLYVNGAEDASGSSFAGTVSTNYVYWGNVPDGSKPGGELADVRVWDQMLTATEIASLCAAEHGRGELPFAVAEAGELVYNFWDGYYKNSIRVRNVPGDLPAEMALYVVPNTPTSKGGDLFIGQRTRLVDRYVPILDAADKPVPATLISCGSHASIDDLHDGALTYRGKWWLYGFPSRGTVGAIITKDKWRLEINDTGQLVGTIECADADAVAISEETVPLEQWVELSMTWDDASYTYPRLWINGREVRYESTQARDGAVVSDAADTLYIQGSGGGSDPAPGYPGRQILDNTVRHTAEYVPVAMWNHPAADGNTIIQYNMNEGSGTTLDNAEGTADRDGTLQPAESWTSAYYGANTAIQNVATALGAYCARKTTLSTSWSAVKDFVVCRSLLNIHGMFGRYRVLARVYDHGATAGALQLRARPFMSAMDATYCADMPHTEPASPAKVGVWQMVDLGLVELPPMRVRDRVWDGRVFYATGTKAMFIELQAKRTSGTENVDVDFLMLLPADAEGQAQKWDSATSAVALLVDSGADDPPFGGCVTTSLFTDAPQAYGTYEGDLLRLPVGQDSLLAFAWRGREDWTDKHEWGVTTDDYASVYMMIHPRFRWVR